MLGIAGVILRSHLKKSFDKHTKINGTVDINMFAVISLGSPQGMLECKQEEPKTHCTNTSRGFASPGTQGFCWM